MVIHLQEVRKCSSVFPSFCGQCAHSLSSLEPLSLSLFLILPPPLPLKNVKKKVKDIIKSLDWPFVVLLCNESSRRSVVCCRDPLGCLAVSSERCMDMAGC